MSVHFSPCSMPWEMLLSTSHVLGLPCPLWLGNWARAGTRCFCLQLPAKQAEIWQGCTLYLLRSCWATSSPDSSARRQPSRLPERRSQEGLFARSSEVGQGKEASRPGRAQQWARRVAEPRSSALGDQAPSSGNPGARPGFSLWLVPGASLPSWPSPL